MWMKYILAVSLCWGIFYGIYILWLRKETYFIANRWYLILTILAGLCLPVFSMLPNFSDPVPDTAVTFLAPIVDQVSLLVEDSGTTIVSRLTVSHILWMIYCIGTGIFAIRFVAGIVQILDLYNNGQKKSNGIQTIVYTRGSHPPFAFLSCVFISQINSYTQEELYQIHLHENVHIRQAHTLDVLLVEVLQIVFWCSPFVYFYKKSLRSIHEYTADRVLSEKIPVEKYCELLLAHSNQKWRNHLANHLFQSQIKNRIIMMTKNRSKKASIWKFTLAIPAALLLIFFFSIQGIRADQKLSTEPDDISSMSVHDSLPDGEIFKVVEEMPLFPGCSDVEGNYLAKKDCSQMKMMEYIYKNIKYPKKARERGIQGTVIISFIVEKDGKLSNYKIKRDIGGDCGKAALDVVKTMPRWIPGRQRGVNVNVRMNLPVKFRLGSGPQKKRIHQ